ncbi:putative Cysteine/Histidine-rich C1 domain family protein [Quillaja saponaria]|uniref:Cysteine/Histidine-rich C1 domain family protein n=1 Tax=Quillaja saponaria TaxID=32244 RepID=A0AAD7PY27_QUISA|nr:putative Cysteine/Histidine-rich C1 domain family protein [Quillaja saponaria]
MEITEKNHPSHPHTLILKPPGAPFQCSGCKELGFGPSYRCENNCKFILHDECANAPPSYFHPLFKDRDFNFHLNVPGSRPRICDGCGKDVLGSVYQCPYGDYDFHPCCLMLQRTITISAEDTVKTLYLSNKVGKKCQNCKSKYSSKGCKGWSYASSDDKYCYHVACVKEIILENWRRGYFNEATAYEIQPHNHGFQSLVVVPSREMVVPGRGRSFRKKVSKLAKVVFKLIVSAIFGDPVSMVATLVEALATD